LLKNSCINQVADVSYQETIKAYKMMNTYPVNLLLAGKRCLIVGGGKVATRKLPTLLNSGALVSIIAPESTKKIKNAAQCGALKLYEREFVESDLSDMALVFLATSDQVLNRHIMELAEVHGILVCCVDANWREGSFITPASLNHNDITIAISSQGVACRKTKLIKENLARHIDSIENTELLVIGTDHNLADINQRENVHLTGNRLDKAGKLIMTLMGIHEFMLLNTCNRVEVIAAGHDDETIIEMIKMILKLEWLEPGHYYIKSGFEAFRHLCLVTSGLLSQTPGENHITAQFKQTFDYAQDKAWSGSLMKTLKDHILHVSKHIRSEVVPMLKVFEIEELAMAFLKSRISELKGKHVLLAGTGIIGRAMKDILVQEGCMIDWIYYSTEPEIKDEGVTVSKLSMLETKVPEADIIISALSSEHPIISREMAHFFKDDVEAIDLGSPRNIAADLASCEKIKLTDMEDLKHWHRRNNCDMESVLETANCIIDEHRDIYEKFRKSFIDGRQGQ
jgi:glutamyl-tRNA reductase